MGSVLAFLLIVGLLGGCGLAISWRWPTAEERDVEADHRFLASLERATRPR